MNISDLPVNSHLYISPPPPCFLCKGYPIRAKPHHQSPYGPGHSKYPTNRAGSKRAQSCQHWLARSTQADPGQDPKHLQVGAVHRKGRGVQCTYELYLIDIQLCILCTSKTNKMGFYPAEIHRNIFLLPTPADSRISRYLVQTNTYGYGPVLFIKPSQYPAFITL